MIRWVFFDVGNVLLDEDPLSFLNTYRHWEAARSVHPDLSFETLLNLREERAVAGSRWPLHDVVARYLDDQAIDHLWRVTEREVRGRYSELSPLLPGVPEMLEELSSRFRLGIIANQGPECRERLAALALLDRFDTIVLSEDVGAFKPDPAIFGSALENTGARSSECLMVGDRLDNDIQPAAALGLATAWVRWPRREAKGWRPAEPEAVAFRNSLARIAARVATHASQPQPTFVVDEVRELSELLRDAESDSTPRGTH